mgnify:CR=1 FL=1
MKEKFLYFNLEEQATTGAKAVQGSETLTLVAKRSGALGNLISCEITESALASANTPSIVVSGNKITVGVGDASGAGANDVAAAINANAAASALVTATGSADTGIADAEAEFFLENGESSLCIPSSRFIGMTPGSRNTLIMYFKSINNIKASEAGKEVISDTVTLTVGNDNVKAVMTKIAEGLSSSSGRYGFDVVAALDPNNLALSSNLRIDTKIYGLSKVVSAAN